MGNKTHNSFGVLFFIRKERTNEKNEAAIYMRITLNGQRVEMATKYHIAPQKWDSSSNSAFGRKQEIIDLNQKLDKLKGKVINCYNDMMHNNEFLSACVLKNKITGISDKQKTLLETFDYHNKLLKETIGIDYAPATIRRYDTTMTHVKKFLKKQYFKDDIYLRELDYKFVSNFEHYMKVVNNCNHNTTIKYIKNIKKIIHFSNQKINKYEKG